MDTTVIPWESQLVLELFGSNILEFFESSTLKLPETLFELYIQSLGDKTNEVHQHTDLHSIILTLDQNKTIVVASQDLLKLKDESYKVIVQIDELIDQNVLEMKFSENSELNNIHKHMVEDKLKGYNILHFFLFVALGKCKIWPRLFKEIKSGRKKERTWKIHSFFDSFRKDFGDKVQQGFSQAIISKKHQKDIDKETIQKKCNNALIQAVRDGQIAAVKEMLEDGADIESIEGKEGYKPAHTACDVGQMEMIRLLDSYSCNWESLDAELMTPLFYAIRGENIDVIRFLIEEKKINIEHEECMQRTVFYWACCLGNLRIIRYLADAGADINSKTKLRRTALNKACFLGRADVVAFLLSRPGIDIEWGDTKGRNPLHNAIFGPRGGREGKKVVPKKLDLPVAVGTFGKDCPEAAQMLLERGVNIDAEDVDGQTPLHIACSSEALDSIPLLISYGADINKQNKFGDTSLHFAAKFGHIATAKLLIENYEVLLLENLRGQTAMDSALLNEHEDVYSYLAQKMGENFIQTPDQKYRHFRTILEATKDKKQKLYLENFTKYVLKDTDYEQIFSPEILSLLPLLRDSEVFVLLVEKFKPFIEAEKAASNLLLGVIKARRLDLFADLYQHFPLELSTAPFENFSEILDAVLEFNDKEIVQFVFTMNLNIFDYCCTEHLNNSFLHELVIRRKTGVIINFAKYLNKKYPVSQLKNKIMLENQGDIPFMKEFILRKNAQNVNCIELAVIHRYFDIYNILEQLCLKSLMLDKDLVEFGIPEYDVLDLEEYFALIQATLPMDLVEAERQFRSYALSLETRLNSKKDILEQLNQVIETTQIVDQYNINGKIELKFEEQINTLSQLEKQQLFANLKANTPLPIFIDKEEQLIGILLPALKESQIIGVDLEYWHDIKSEQKIAFIATLQISTLTSNFIIDVLQISRQTSEALKPFFESSSYIKIFHGGETDLKLLKKDLNLNMVNIFDTAKAELKQKENTNQVSLSTLSTQYLGLAMDKSYQTSDWRIRPLPAPMLAYAMGDSFTTLILFFAMKMIITKEELVHIAISCNKMCFRQLEKSSLDFSKVYALKSNKLMH